MNNINKSTSRDTFLNASQENQHNTKTTPLNVLPPEKIEEMITDITSESTSLNDKKIQIISPDTNQTQQNLSENIFEDKIVLESQDKKFDTDKVIEVSQFHLDFTERGVESKKRATDTNDSQESNNNNELPHAKKIKEINSDKNSPKDKEFEQDCLSTCQASAKQQNFELAFAQVKNISNSELKNKALKKIVYEASKVASQLPPGPSKNEFLKYISEELTNHEKFDEALDWVMKIPSELRDSVLKNTCLELIKQKKYAQALHVCKNINAYYIQSEILKTIDLMCTSPNNADTFVKFSQLLIENQFIEMAVEVANRIVNNWKIQVEIFDQIVAKILENNSGTDEEKSCKVESLINTLIKLKNFNMAFKLACQLPHTETKDRALLTICKALCDANQIENALKVSEKVVQQITLDKALKAIVKKVAVTDVNKACDFVKDILDIERRDKAWKYICLEIAKKKNQEIIAFKTAREKINNPTMRVGVIKSIIKNLITTISDDKKDAFLRSLTEELLEKSYYDEAVFVANYIQDSYIKDDAFEALCLKFREMNKMDEVQFLLNKISDDSKQSITQSIDGVLLNFISKEIIKENKSYTLNHRLNEAQIKAITNYLTKKINHENIDSIFPNDSSPNDIDMDSVSNLIENSIAKFIFELQQIDKSLSSNLIRSVLVSVVYKSIELDRKLTSQFVDAIDIHVKREKFLYTLLGDGLYFNEIIDEDFVLNH